MQIYAKIAITAVFMLPSANTNVNKLLLRGVHKFAYVREMSLLIVMD